MYTLSRKKLSRLQKSIEEIQYYDSIENEFIKLHYPECTTYRFVCNFGIKQRVLYALQ